MNLFRGSGEIASDVVNTGQFVSFTIKADYEADNGKTYVTYVRCNLFGEEASRKAGPFKRGDFASVEGPLRWDEGRDGYDGKLVCRPDRVSFKQGDPRPATPQTADSGQGQGRGYDDELPF